jgi:hypothetical protein
MSIGERKSALQVLGTAAAHARQWHGAAAPITAQIALLYAAALEASGDRKHARTLRQEAGAITSSSPKPAAHTVDILDLGRR